MKCSVILSVLTGGIIFQAFLVHADDDTLPGNGFPGSRYEVLWTKSPFAVATPEGTAPSPDYALKGIAQFDGIYYATLIEKQNQEHFLLSTDKPARGLKLISITPSKDPSNTSAVIERNGQSITLKLEVTEVTPPAPAAANAAAPTPQIPMPGASTPTGNINPPGADTVPPPATIHPRLIHFPPPPTTTQPRQAPPPAQ